MKILFYLFFTCFFVFSATMVIASYNDIPDKPAHESSEGLEKSDKNRDEGDSSSEPRQINIPTPGNDGAKAMAGVFGLSY